MITETTEISDATIIDFEEAETDQPVWVQIDQWGRVLARRQGEMTLEVCEWLLAARAENVHEAFGHASFAEYAERRLDIEPHTLAEKLRVAHALRRLPLLREEFRTGRRHYSAVRELSRVAVPETEAEWLEATAGMRAKQVERRVRGHSPGQRPSDAPNLELVTHALRFEVPAEVYAAWREVVRLERRDVDRDLSEEEILMSLFQARLRGPCDEGRSNYQVALVQCEDCRRVYQDARGERIELPPEVIERVACDAQHIGRVDGAESHVGRGEQADGARSHVGPPKASQTIPPAVRRAVIRRDGGRCLVDGCANSLWLDVHHLRFRSEAGDNNISNLGTLCGQHHARIHQGFLVAEGEAPHVRFVHADGTGYGQDPEAEDVSTHEAVRSALVNMGFRAHEAKNALAAVRSRSAPGLELEELLRAALQEANEQSGVGRRTAS
jgi:5-methylcytosine-specific restriction endonuclease McrA